MCWILSLLPYLVAHRDTNQVKSEIKRHQLENPPSAEDRGIEVSHFTVGDCSDRKARTMDDNQSVMGNLKLPAGLS